MPASQPTHHFVNAPPIRAESGESTRETFFRYFPVSRRDKQWGTYITTAGASRIPPHSPYPPVAHPRNYDYSGLQTRVLSEFQITYISSGAGWLETAASGRQRILAGHLYILFPGVWHRETPDPDSGWDEHWIGFDGDVARRMIGGKFFSPKQPVIKVRHEEMLLELYTNAIGAIKTNQPALQQVLAGMTLYILSRIYSDKQFKLAGDDRIMTMMGHAMADMREGLTAPLDLQDLARHIGLSYSAFRRKFAHHTGLSPHKYLQELRLARARSLLTETALSTKEIAHQSGFEDEHYFCRFFRKKVAATPSQWRSRERV